MGAAAPILEAAGFHVILVHPAYARQAKRSKYSDLDDSVWLQLMHSYGLLPASSLPPAPFARLRPLWRHRERLIAEQGRCLQQMQDAMELMNIQLHKVLSVCRRGDRTPSLSGRLSRGSAIRSASPASVIPA